MHSLFRLNLRKPYFKSNKQVLNPFSIASSSDSISISKLFSINHLILFYLIKPASPPNFTKLIHYLILYFFRLYLYHKIAQKKHIYFYYCSKKYVFVEIFFLT